MEEFHPRQPSGDAHRFAPAAPDEETVYGACAPGWHSAADHRDAVEDWVRFMERRGVERVCCLVPGPSGGEGTTTLARYRWAFGTDAVLHAPVPDGHLADVATLRDDVLPFFDAADGLGESVVVHCLAGIGRTGQVLAAWLAHDRGYEPDRAVETVEEMGRHPREAVRAGHATEEALSDLLTAVC